MKRALMLPALLSFLPVHAEGRPLPKALPLFAAEAKLPVPELRRHTLPNGMTVWLIPQSGFPKVSAILAIRGGTDHDPKERPGISGLMAQLLKEGTVRQDARALADALQGIGGEVRGWSTLDGIFLAGSSLASGSGTLVDLLGEMARNPSFPSSEVELLSQKTLSSLEAQEADPQFLAGRAFRKSLFGDHPYGSSGPEKSWVGALDRAQISEVYAARVRPDRSLLILIGNFDPASAFRGIIKSFGGWKVPATEAQEKPALPPKEFPARWEVVNRPGSVQTTLVMGKSSIPRTHPEFPALYLAVEVAGGGFVSSRITWNLREEKGYAYSPRMSPTTMRMGGTISERVAVRNEVTGAAVAEIFYELDRMNTTIVPDEELAKARRSSGGKYLSALSTLNGFAQGLGAAWTEGVMPESFFEWIQRLQTVTPEQVKRASRAYLNPRTFTVVAVGDEGVIRDELAPFMPTPTSAR